MEKICPRKFRPQNFIRLLIVTFVAVNLSGLAIALFLEANLGSDTITVFIDGVHRILNIGYGDASRIYNIILLAIAIMLSRKHIGWMTIAYAMTIGYALDFYGSLFTMFNLSCTGLSGKLGMILIAQILFGIAYALLISFGKGMNQVDAIAFYICQKWDLKYLHVRIAMDAMLLVGGWLMGGVVGIGSLIAMISTSFFINSALRAIKRLEFVNIGNDNEASI